MKIFLLGHRGFIGSNLLPKLLEAGHVVKTDPILHWGETFDVVVNLAAKTHINNIFDPKLIESNIILAQKVFERSERIVYASSCSARHFTNPYAMSKMWSEYLGAQHSNSLGLRFFNVYGKNNNKGIVWWLLQQKDGVKITVRGPDLIRDYITVEDVVEFIVKQAIPGTKKIYPFCDPRQKLREARNIGVVDVGTKIGTSTMDLINIFQKISGKRFDITIAESGDNEPAEMVAWNSKIQNPISLEQGLTILINNQF